MERSGRDPHVLNLSAGEAGGADAFDQVALEENEHGEDWEQGQAGHGEDRPPVGDAGGVGVRPQRYGDRVQPRIVQIDQRVQEITPGEIERENRGGSANS